MNLTRDLEIIDNFLYNYQRSPKFKEFVNLGGSFRPNKHSHYLNYSQFLEENGYDVPTNGNVYEVYDIDGKFVTSGTSRMLSEEMGWRIPLIARAARYKNVVDCLYRIKKVEIDIPERKKWQRVKFDDDE